MATPLNPGFTNNINVIQLRLTGSSLQRLTDRPIDSNNDGVNEFEARAVVQTTVESDGGKHSDLGIGEFTTGVE